VGSEQDFAQGVPQIGALGDVDGEGGQSVGDAVFGGLGERVAVSGHEREDAQDGAGVVELGAGDDVDAALVEEEVGAGDGGAAAAELAVEADRSGQVLHEQGGAAVDDAGVSIVGPHPVGRVGGAAGFKSDGVGGGLVLGLPVEILSSRPWRKWRKQRAAARKSKAASASPRALWKTPPRWRGHSLVSLRWKSRANQTARW